jgi:hypothetical protein
VHSRALALAVEDGSCLQAGTFQSGARNALDRHCADGVFNVTLSVLSHFMHSKVH